MPTDLEYGARDICEPEFPTWHDLLVENRVRRQGYAQSACLSGLSTLRTEIRESAIEYTKELGRVAGDSSLPRKEQPTSIVGSSTGDTIISGHQPVIFHPGILYKTVLLSRFARENAATGVLVLIDTVEGDAGEFLVPAIRDGKYQIRPESLCEEPGLMARQRIADRSVLRDVFDKAHADFWAMGFFEEAQQTIAVAKRYALLAGQPVGMANSIVRRIYEGGPAYLEIPLSRLAQLPTVRSFFQRILENAIRFHDVYNQTLDAFRKEHKIKNAANPFPNLRTKKASRELPFWRIDGQHGVREPLFIAPGMRTSNDQDSQIMPRGMLITILLRLLASDLFIHGTGGAAYDRCTDIFISNYFGVVPPSFCVASATRYLFARELSQQERFERRDQQLRDMVYNVERYLAEGAFPVAVRATLEPLVAGKRELISRLKEAKNTGQSASEFGKELQRIDTRLKEVVREALDKELEGIHRLRDDQHKLIAIREFPYFYFRQSMFPTA